MALEDQITASASPRSREVRLGVVMYGGVSLAIYINGVSQEIFRAVEGCGVYKLLKSCFDTDIVVDIISGTSAGGINGLLLAYALTNHKDFSTTKELWRVHGDIDKLLYKADADPDACKSLLDSDSFYRARLADAFQQLDGSAFHARACEPSLFQEMDVFITGTSYEPDIYTTFDDAGRAIEMLDYRKVFRLKHRALRSNPGAFRPTPLEKPTRFEAFAKLARVTSCFPGAFLPVRVLSAADWQNRDPTRESPPFPAREKEVDALLCEWGSLAKSSYFLDGGVLDNKPFTPTISAIFGRTADRPVDRVLFYVEPDPEKAPSIEGAPCQPSFISSIVNGVVGIATYQSVTDDARLLEQHNSAVVRHSSICRELEGKLPRGVRGVGVPADLQDPQRTLYISARNTCLASRALRGLLWDSKTGTSAHLTSAADRERVKQLFHSLNEPRERGELTYDQTFERYDIYFRLRRVQHVVKWLYLALSDLGDQKTGTARNIVGDQETRTARKILRGLNQHVQLLEIIQYWFEFALDRIPVDWRSAQATSDPATEIWRQVTVCINQILSIKDNVPSWLPAIHPADPEWLSTKQLDTINHGLRDDVGRLLGRFKQSAQNPAAILNAPPTDESFRGFLQWTDEAEAAFFLAHADTSAAYEMAKAEYDEFVSLDAIVFPLDFVSSLANFNEIRLLRISPSPTLNSRNQGFLGFKANAGADEKLAGRQLGHFAGFLKRSWRSNDILWGRLDGLRHLVLCLVTSERIGYLRKDPALRARVWHSLGEDGGLRKLVASSFPQSPPASHDELANFFTGLLSSSAWTPTDTELEAALNLLVEMGQLEIINEEISTVLQDAAEQQAYWNRFRKQAGKHAIPPPSSSPAAPASPPPIPPSSFGAPAGFLDPAVIGLHIADQIARLKDQWNQTAPAVQTPKDTRLGAYFEKTYDVAGEGLERGLPPLVLVEYLTRTLLVLDACILGALPPKLKDKISGNWIYRFFLRFPLKLSYKVVTLWSREPGLTAISLTSALVAGMVGFALIVYFWINSTPAWTTRLGMICIAALLIVVSWFLLKRRKRLGL